MQKPIILPVREHNEQREGFRPAILGWPKVWLEVRCYVTAPAIACGCRRGVLRSQIWNSRAQRKQRLRHVLLSPGTPPV